MWTTNGNNSLKGVRVKRGGALWGAPLNLGLFLPPFIDLNLKSMEKRVDIWADIWLFYVMAQILSLGDRGDHQVIPQPYPHILVESKKKLHGWWEGKRECTAERLLLNPYNGCSVNCFFCYAHALPGYFRLFRERGILTVCRDFDKEVAKQLDSLRVVSCGYLSPVTEPFQGIEAKYSLSLKIIREFVSRNIPIEFITKAPIPEGAIKLLTTQKHSFGQVSILTLDEGLRQSLMEEGATTDELFDNLRRLAKAGLHSVCRIDPIIPFLTDGKRELAALVQRAVDSGASHIVASILDIPLSMAREVWAKFSSLGIEKPLRELYRERIGNSLHARIDYRKRVFGELRQICDRLGVTFALCMEYELRDGRPIGLNRVFMSSTNCEGIDIPIYVRRDGLFQPAASCTGACLTCKNPICGIKELAMGREENLRKSFNLQDYRRWSQGIEALELI